MFLVCSMFVIMLWCVRMVFFVILVVLLVYCRKVMFLLDINGFMYCRWWFLCSVLCIEIVFGRLYLGIMFLMYFIMKLIIVFLVCGSICLRLVSIICLICVLVMICFKVLVKFEMIIIVCVFVLFS